ncbi:MAG: phosphatidylglycerol lysyltransferase domain-containing protein [Desulfovibrio sp.]|nr:phosphatidylglycerol lysyltransferase domain-containing protein [Desulfovibrio sp.]
MSKEFAPVSLERTRDYYDVWEKTPTHTLDYTLVNLWGWQQYFGLEWAFDGDLCWIRQTRPNTVYWAPLGAWGLDNWRDILSGLVKEGAASFIRIPEDLANLWKFQAPDLVAAVEDRGQWEYIYSKEDLASLPGPKFHKKRTHVNSYIKAYGDPVYVEITPKLVEEVLGVQDTWCQWHECAGSPSLEAENEAIARVLTHWDNFRHMYGGSLEIEGKMVAFSVGEKLDSETLGVHFEKGLNGYKGVYQVMNREFASRAGKDFKFINRAQDMNEDGLRQAKLTYSPVGYAQKYSVSLKA